jgi:RNA polymerase sigma factor (sigma-70 family)
MNDEYVTSWSGLVNSIAHQFARRYPMIEQPDIAQEIWLWFLTHEKKLEQWESEHDTRTQLLLISRAVRNAALKYCEKEKSRVVGYELSDLHYYDKSTVEIFLPYILSDDYQIPSELNVVNSESKSTKDPSEGNGWLAMWADISKGFDKLPEHHQNILRERFLNEQRTYKDVGAVFNISEDAARKRTDRAIKALINKIGGDSPWK